ncbi:hypothetical protein GCM10007298_35560 [Williamsia phyllosphaerae]|uniref:Uncharacterized protein n=1 Tax=Williamsia phyllosphaerae TaxID=885042 RepID=A0ABQ1V527_9NOCA|nr:hypothetical protein GCM10007298_35560 [Williamsia phyllosphaerae]
MPTSNGEASSCRTTSIGIATAVTAEPIALIAAAAQKRGNDDLGATMEDTLAVRP